MKVVADIRTVPGMEVEPCKKAECISQYSTLLTKGTVFSKYVVGTQSRGCFIMNVSLILYVTSLYGIGKPVTGFKHNTKQRF